MTYKCSNCGTELDIIAEFTDGTIEIQPCEKCIEMEVVHRLDCIKRGIVYETGAK